jgi:hypothetical protein
MAQGRAGSPASRGAGSLLFISFTFSNDLTQDEFLDRIRADLEDLLNDADFRTAMRWDKPQDR